MMTHDDDLRTILNRLIELDHSIDPNNQRDLTNAAHVAELIMHGYMRFVPDDRRTSTSIVELTELGHQAADLLDS